MSINPLHQFEIQKIFEISLYGYDISFTNSSLAMAFSVCIIALFYFASLRKSTLVPGKMQLIAEESFTLISSMLEDITGSKDSRFSPLIFSIFIFILLCNLIGIIPYSFTVTSHIAVTFFIAAFLFIIITFYGFMKHGVHFLSLFLPKGTPFWLAPLMILIELFAYLARPVSLSLRLAANMIAGHVLLKVMASFAVMLAFYFKWLPIAMIILITGFEIFVAILQAYIFTILACVYLNDAVNLH